MKNNLRLVLALCAGSLLFALPTQAATLTAFGRVLPRSGIVDLAGVAGDTIEAIHVKEGDLVEAGQSLARLSSATAAGERLARAEADLANLRTSTAKDIEFALGRVKMAESEAKFAHDRFERLNRARDSDFVSPDQVEQRSLDRQTAATKVEQARQEVEKSRRDSDKAIRAAEADVTAARLQLTAAEVRSPLKARVLKIRGRVGATVGRTEIVKLGDTSTMIVLAEIYEADVLKVKTGQKATISSAALPKKMTGVVTGVSSLVFRNSIESIDPNESTQGRIVEVTVQMNEAEPLDRLVLLQVDVVLDL
jgi:HlyD family secretion protein